ncbi:FAD-dependent oxidoreductase [Pseudonocardia pini]|uniref:FAD-dependent oxidoreductase n=1 Tax=Pseudonocardia pini TaxID=2758030 RepID=UPI0015F0695D|nr:NAD(P)/FAD-dependent oxidoreductase [Pseudonocardia pini]
MSRHVEIAGGGIAGLTIATLFAREGWTATVHERQDAIREVGSGLVVHQSSAVVFEEIGALEEIAAGATRFRTSALGDEQGRILWKKTLGEESRTYNPLRTSVINAVHKAAVGAGVEIRTDSMALSAVPAGVLRTSAREERPADLVIAADGLHSAVRDSLPITVEKKMLNAGCTRTVIPRGDFDRHDGFLELWSGSLRLGICPTSPTQSYIYYAAREDDERGSAVPVDVDYWAANFPGLPQEFLDRLPQGDAIRHAYSLVRLDRWSAGKVAVIGDACHTLPPTLGQGVGLAVGNARALVHDVAHADDVPAALARWERRIRPVIDTTQDWSMRYELLSSRWPRFGQGLRKKVLQASRHPRIQRGMTAADRAAKQWAA